MSLIFDHIVIKVQNLPEACARFEHAGFTVTQGGIHKGGISENALIFFQDGTFLELLKIRKSMFAIVLRWIFRLIKGSYWSSSKKMAMLHRFYNRAFQLHTGITDFCLLADAYEADIKSMEDSGLWLSAPLRASRKKPDGSTTNWKMLVPKSDVLPFLRSDYWPKGNSPAKCIEHANKIQGISTFDVFVKDVDASVAMYQRLLGSTPEYAGENAIFSLNSTQLIISAIPNPTSDSKVNPSTSYSIKFTGGLPKQSLDEFFATS